MIKPLALVPVMLAAMPAFAQESASAQLAAFVSVFKAHDCVLATKGENAIPEPELMEMFAAVGIGEQQVAGLATGLLESGQATVDEATDAVTVLAPLCSVEGGE